MHDGSHSELAGARWVAYELRCTSRDQGARQVSGSRLFGAPDGIPTGHGRVEEPVRAGVGRDPFRRWEP